MNKKFVQAIKEIFNFIDHNIILIIVGAICLWVYYFGVITLAVLLTVFILIWGVIKYMAIKTNIPIYEKVKKLILTSSPLKKESSPIEQTKKIPIIKTLLILLAYLALILFLLFIVLYNGALIGELPLKIVGVLATIFYVGTSLFEMEKDEQVKKVLKRYSDHVVNQKIKKVFFHFIAQVFLLFTYLFPFVVLGAVIIVLMTGLNFMHHDIMLSVILLYIINIVLLLLNAYTMNIRDGFLILSGKWGAVFKTILYIFSPIFLISMFIVGGLFISALSYLFSSVLAIGSVWLIYKDTLYRDISIPTLHASGKAFTGSYLKNLFRYGLVILISIGVYYGAAHIYNQEEPSSEPPPEIRSVTKSIQLSFGDLKNTHWAFEAIVHLYDQGVIQPNEDNFVYPGEMLSTESVIRLLFSYFDIQSEDFQEKEDVYFNYIPKWHEERYVLFKAAYYLNLIDLSTNPEEEATKKLVLKSMAILDNWEIEESEEIQIVASQKGVIKTIAPETLDQPVDRAILAQLLYNSYLIKTQSTLE